MLRQECRGQSEGLLHHPHLNLGLTTPGQWNQLQQVGFTSAIVSSLESDYLGSDGVLHSVAAAMVVSWSLFWQVWVAETGDYFEDSDDIPCFKQHKLLRPGLRAIQAEAEHCQNFKVGHPHEDVHDVCSASTVELSNGLRNQRCGSTSEAAAR